MSWVWVLWMKKTWWGGEISRKAASQVFRRWLVIDKIIKKIQSYYIILFCGIFNKPRIWEMLLSFCIWYINIYFLFFMKLWWIWFLHSRNFVSLMSLKGMHIYASWNWTRTCPLFNFSSSSRTHSLMSLTIWFCLFNSRI